MPSILKWQCLKAIGRRKKSLGESRQRIIMQAITLVAIRTQVTKTYRDAKMMKNSGMM
jgi:hypothetical protein